MNRRTIFFRIWFGLKEGDILRTVIGSVAAGFSGISKPLFGFFIMTIGVAYYEKDAKQKVGRFSLFFSLVGLFSLFTHILQHYFFGVVYCGMKLAWFEKPENNAGSLTSRIITDTAVVKTIISDRMSVIVQCISSILIATIVSAVVNWRMALVAWAVMPCHFIGGYIQAISAKGFSGKLKLNLNTPETSDFRRIEGEIEFQNVKFNYPLRPEVTVLNNFSLQIEPGLKVALVGPSGAGKSSVIALLLRFYDPREGRILIHGKDIKEYNLRRLRSQIGLVQQEPLLFSSSIRSNIYYGNDKASESEIVEASKKANIHEFISSLPDGYDTVVGEKGCQLSGGQKQRIAIARTLLKKPAILLLDEATSALDGESERVIVSALESLNQKGSREELPSRITQITVAHRLSTVMNSDTIVVMDKGEIVEMGSHSTLVAASQGVYSRLYQLQSFGGN
ncbi:hypothetical protein Patl1_25921 [Pistacia atlantica]|uniref:Uncharacterized protein n=1 Tax=Pistacia atlantica TaxID=434234 RepID=A0ACC1B423_9ROSI|nr:hypothetical protein Patl1_25921 [Pistacia atlantica]